MAAIETEKETTTLMNLLICNEIFALNFAIESNLQSTMSNLDFFTIDENIRGNTASSALLTGVHVHIKEAEMTSQFS